MSTHHTHVNGFCLHKKIRTKRYLPEKDLIQNLVAEKKKIFLFKEKCRHNGTDEDHENHASNKNYDKNGIEVSENYNSKSIQGKK